MEVMAYMIRIKAPGYPEYESRRYKTNDNAADDFDEKVLDYMKKYDLKNASDLSYTYIIGV